MVYSYYARIIKIKIFMLTHCLYSNKLDSSLNLGFVLSGNRRFTAKKKYIEFNTVSPSPGSVERIFLLASVTLSSRKNRLSDKMLKFNVVFQSKNAVYGASSRILKHKQRLLSLFRCFNCVPMCNETCPYN